MGLSQKIVFFESIDILSCENLVSSFPLSFCVDDYRRITSFLLLILGQHIQMREHGSVTKIAKIDLKFLFFL